MVFLKVFINNNEKKKKDIDNLISIHCELFEKNSKLEYFENKNDIEIHGFLFIN
jgi:hypothetical protein